MAQQIPDKKYYRLELEPVDEWDVKAFAAEDLGADLLISDAGYLVISEAALKALKAANIELPPEHPLKVVKASQPS